MSNYNDPTTPETAHEYVVETTKLITKSTFAANLERDQDLNPDLP